jgi:hypothetical protein
MFRSPLSALIAVAVLVAATTSASAHRLGTPPHEMYAKADVVLVGRVESIGAKTMHVVVGETLKGEKKGAVDVGPLFEPGCCVYPEGQEPPHKPDFAVGDRVFVVAKSDKNVLWLMGLTFEARLKDEAAEKRAVAFAREMLRIVALPDLDARRAAMIALLSSEDQDRLYAASAFLSAELDTPEKARPHVAALVMALDAPTNYGRAVAMRALVGVGAPAAFDRLIALSKRRDADTSRGACEALACYDREEAVVAILAAGHVALLGESPRPEARPTLLRALSAEDSPSRAAGYAGFIARFSRFGATDAELDLVIAALRRETSLEAGRTAVGAVESAGSVKAAAALVALVADERSTEDARAAACHSLWDLSKLRPVPGVADLLHREEKLFERRLDEGSEMYLCWVLGVIHTPDARAALERARKKDAPGMNSFASRTLDGWDER